MRILREITYKLIRVSSPINSFRSFNNLYPLAPILFHAIYIYIYIYTNKYLPRSI